MGEGADSETTIVPRGRLATVEEATRTDEVRLSEIWSGSPSVLSGRRESLLRSLDAWQDVPAIQDEANDDAVLAKLLEARSIAVFMASAPVTTSTEPVWRDRPFVDLASKPPLRGRFERLWLQDDAEAERQAAVVGTVTVAGAGPSSAEPAEATACLLRAAAARVLGIPEHRVEVMVAILDAGEWVGAPDA